MAQYQYIGFDPAPGDHTVTDSLAGGLVSGSETLGRVKFLLAQVDEDQWIGETAIAFRSMLKDEFQPKVVEASQAFDKAAQALTTWAFQLEVFRGQADALDRELGEAKAALSLAEANLYGLPEPRQPDDDAPPHAWDQYQEIESNRVAAQQHLADAHLVVNGIWQRIEGLVTDYGSASRLVLNEFDTAAAMAPNDPSLLHKFVDGMGDAWEKAGDMFAALGDKILEWAAENAGLLDMLSDILGVLSLVATVIAFIPIPGLQIFGLVSVLLSGAATAAAYLSASGQAGSFAEGFTPGVIAGMVGTALGVGALTATFKATVAAAGASGKLVPSFKDFISPVSPVGAAASEALPGFFTLAAKGGEIRTTAEAAWRGVDMLCDLGVVPVVESFNWFSKYGHLHGDDYNGILPDWGATAGETDGEGALLRAHLEGR